MKFSIVIPVYNEERRIPRVATKILDFFKGHRDQIEITFVDDGSTDSTKRILESLAAEQPGVKIISYPRNKGKGYAVRQGALAATGDWVVFFDIDLATPLEEFTRLISFIRQKDDIIIGSRRMNGSRIDKHESGLRVFLGQGFTRLSNILVPGISDFTCGFKCFSRDAVRMIFPIARIDRWGFDTELLYIAKLKDIPIRQMPVAWSHDSDSRVKVWKAVWSSARELAQMKMNELKGLYR